MNVCPEFRDLIYGGMLGDAGLSTTNEKYFYYKHVGKDEEFLKWLEKLYRAHMPLLHTSVRPDNLKKTLFRMGFYVNSTKDPFLLSIYSKWYTRINERNIKHIPSDLELTPTILLHWYLGDGCLTRSRNNRIPRIVLATNCFSDDDLTSLQKQLQGLGLSFYTVPSTSGFTGKPCGFLLVSHTKDGTPFRFFRLIGKCPPEIADCYTGSKGRGSHPHYFRNKWPTEEDWIRILSNTNGIGRIIRIHRKQRGWTSRELAIQANLSSRFVRHIEFGDRFPSVEPFKRLLKALSMDSKSFISLTAEEAYYGIRSYQAGWSENRGIVSHLSRN